MRIPRYSQLSDVIVCGTHYFYYAILTFYISLALLAAVWSISESFGLLDYFLLSACDGGGDALDRVPVEVAQLQEDFFR